VREIREERPHRHRGPPQERRNWISGRGSPRPSTSGAGSLRDSMGSERVRVSHEFGGVLLEGGLRAFGFLPGGDGGENFIARFDNESPRSSPRSPRAIAREKKS
jgi:hypothetical protein